MHSLLVVLLIFNFCFNCEHLGWGGEGRRRCPLLRGKPGTPSGLQLPMTQTLFIAK